MKMSLRELKKLLVEAGEMRYHHKTGLRPEADNIEVNERNHTWIDRTNVMKWLK